MRTIYLDTETTGLSAKHDDVLEISIIDDEGVVLVDTLVRPPRKRWWPEAQAIHGITPAMCRGKPTLASLAPLVGQVFGAYDELVIYNAGYDRPFILAAGIPIPDSLKVRCAMLGFANAYGGGKWQKLAVAAAHVGHIWEGDAHRALADARAARSVWQWLRAGGR